ncbi:uncharacterized protein LOC144664478 isoform X1 [Oculina patagonica]
MALSFLYFFFVASLSPSVKSLTSFKGSVDVADGILVYANFFPFPHHKLNSTPVESRAVSGDQDCIAACAESSQCRSLNFKPVPDENGKFICHLLDTDKFNSSELFNASVDFHHYSFAAPCDHNPCRNGGTCYPVTGEYDFKCACTPLFRGKRCHSRAHSRHQNCAEFLEAGFGKSGVYEIKENLTEMFNVYCDQSSKGGGWTMVFKLVSGVSADVYQLWSSEDSLNENNAEALNVISSLREHYKNRFVQNWQTVNPKEVRVALYTNGSEVLSLFFDSVDADKENWFSKYRLTQAPWNDVKSEPHNYFSIIGHPPERAFFINRNYGGCEVDAGWLLVSSDGKCAFEYRLPTIAIMYSKLETYTSWDSYENVGIADVLAVFIR